MSKNESRRERKKGTNNNGISNIYYWIIGILFLILIGLVLFIFSRSGEDVNIAENEEQTSVVEENETNETEDVETTEENEEADQEETIEDNENVEDAENTEEDVNTEEAAEQEDAQEDTASIVNEDAPHNPDHMTDYSEGSSDRIEIKNRVMEVTGLDDDLIERWVGNNGPGRVVVTVSSRDQTEHYEVYLQYGDGNWHVTSYEQLSENPGSPNE